MIVFLLLIIICIALLYVMHKYFGKIEFYLLAVIYSIMSFLMSFKIINILGIDVNGGIIFSSGLLAMLYYFINRYSENEYKKFISLVISTTIICICILFIASFMVPSIYDNASILYQELMFDNMPIVILYPITNFITLFFSSYCFKELKKESMNKIIKTIFTLVGIVFIDVFIFIYFIYAFLIRFDTAIIIALGNCFVKMIILFIYIFVVNKLFAVKKVK